MSEREIQFLKLFAEYLFLQTITENQLVEFSYNEVAVSIPTN